MAAIVSYVLGQLTEVLKQHGRLVLDAEKDVKKLTSTFTSIEALLLDAEEKQLKEKGVEVWLTKLKDVSYEIDDVLDEWRTEILKRRLNGDDDDADYGWLELKLLQISDVVKRVCPFLPAYCFSPSEICLRYAIGSRIKKLNGSLDDVAADKVRYSLTPRQTPMYQSLQTSPNINFSDVKGRKEEIEMLRHKLLDDESHPRVQSVSIQGTGGLGKTTLAKRLYNDEVVEAHFEKRVWVCVSNTFDEATVAKAILESLSRSTPQSNTLSFIMEQIMVHTKGNRFLLVLDDVWERSPSKWKEIMSSVSHGSSGSKILVTTRKEEVSFALGCKEVDILRIDTMSEETCWEIFTQVAFYGWSAEEKERVEDLYNRVVERCYGSPLAAKVLGGVMQPKKSKREWVQLLRSEIWQLKEGREEVLRPLALSYYDLPPAIRQCFLFCSVFPKDFQMKKGDLIKLWMSQGFLKEAGNDQDMEEIGERYFQILAMRSFFQDVQKKAEWIGDRIYCRMHDLVHDFARLISKNECKSMMNSDANSSTIGSSIIEVRHLMINYSVDSSLFLGKKHNSLRSFIARGAEMVEPHLYNHMRGIRSLVLDSCSLEEIPPTISHLIHLRYLDLSRNHDLMELPEEICELYNLETLLLNMNWRLEKLPRGMGDKLVNLKHLENGNVPANLPDSIRRLTSLKTLFIFHHSEEQDGAASIGDLENMNQLQGFLCVSGLSKVTDCGEVKRAQLDKKEALTHLNLQFRQRLGASGNEEVLEAIRPPSNLEQLDVMWYSGRRLYPSWLLSLCNLTTLEFHECLQVEQLPPLGALPSLETLILNEMSKVEKVGGEFLLGNASTTVKQQQQHGMTTNIIAFPKLKVLKFWDLRSWKVWELEWDDEESTVMPQLSHLHLHFCEELQKLPDVLLRKTTLQKLEINHSGGFGGYKYKGKMPWRIWDSISHIPTLIFNSQDIRTEYKSEIESISGGGSYNYPESEESEESESSEEGESISGGGSYNYPESEESEGSEEGSCGNMVNYACE